MKNCEFWNGVVDEDSRVQVHFVPSFTYRNNRKGYSFFTHTVHETRAPILVERYVNCVHVQLSIHIRWMTRIF